MTYRGLKNIAVLLAAGVLPLCAQSEGTFLSVKAWQGQIRLTSSSDGKVTSMFGTEEWTTSFRADLTLKLDQYDPASQTWSGPVSGNVAIRHKLVHTMPDGCVVTHTADANGSPDTSITDFGTLHIASGIYWFNPMATSVRGRRITKMVCPTSSGTILDGESGEQWWPVTDTSFSSRVSLPVNTLNLEGGADVKLGFPLTVFGYQMNGGQDPQLPARLTWQFRPLAKDEDEVVVRIPGYANWRPEAGAGGGRGNSLSMTAELQRSGGGAPSSKAVRFEWEFLQMSREPGYALNAPSINALRDPDMRFDPAADLLVDDPDGQKARTPDGEYITSRANAVSMDWGGFGTLKVTAILTDGRRITGHLEDDPQLTEILLPKRAQGDLIAEVWRRQQNVGSLGDTTDDDDFPEGDGNRGDGLSLYEEYRGFIEGGKHIEGNPRKKDFFILNLAGGAYVPGILLFAEESKLEVHHQFDSVEFPASRVINANTAAGPHRVDQHGIVIVAVNPNRGYAEAESDTGEPDTPAHISRVTTSRILSSTTPQVRQSLWAGLAHELFHACNVWHHGDEGDRQVIWKRKPDSDSVWLEQNADGTGEAQEIRVRYEDGRLYSPVTGNIPRKIYLGGRNGLHSGHDGCVMRYDVSQAYVDEKDPSVRYRVQEEGGFFVCATAEGTGVNAQGRQPQSRYSGAAARRGDCVHQILVNDAIRAPKR